LRNSQEIAKEKMFEEYQKAVNNLTINEENRLKMKVEILESEKTSYEKLDAKLDALQREFYQNKVRTGWAGLTKEDLSDAEIEQKLQQRRMQDKLRRERDKQLMQDL